MIPEGEEEEVGLKDVEVAETVDAVAEGRIEMPRPKGSLVGCDITQGQLCTRNCPFADPGFRCEEPKCCFFPCVLIHGFSSEQSICDDEDVGAILRRGQRPQVYG